MTRRKNQMREVVKSNIQELFQPHILKSYMNELHRQTPERFNTMKRHVICFMWIYSRMRKGGGGKAIQVCCEAVRGNICQHGATTNTEENLLMVTGWKVEACWKFNCHGLKDESRGRGMGQDTLPVFVGMRKRFFNISSENYWHPVVGPVEGYLLIEEWNMRATDTRLVEMFL